jgi:hypothetical protein
MVLKMIKLIYCKSRRVAVVIKWCTFVLMFLGRVGSLKRYFYLVLSCFCFFTKCFAMVI